MYRLRLTRTGPSDPDTGAFDPFYRLYLIDDEGIEVTLFENPLDGKELSEWFMENMKSIRSEEPPFRQLPGDSLARSRALAWDFVISEVEEFTGSFEMFSACRDVVVRYWQQHSLRAGASGMEFPNIYFGLGSEGPEVSCDEPPDFEWCYRPVDFDEFFDWLAPAIVRGEFRFC